LFACGEVNSFISWPQGAIAPAATVLLMVKRSWIPAGGGVSVERS